MMFIHSVHLGQGLECKGILVANLNVRVVRLEFELLLGQYLAVPSPLVLEIIT